MTTRIPPDAFEQYVALGDDRSYERLAEELGVTKRSICRRAAKDNWQSKLAAMERAARDDSEARMQESISSMRERHLRTMKAIQGKALEALRAYPLTSAMDAVRALDMSIKQERLIRGEPTERQTVSIEETIRREYDRWMTTSEDESEVAEEP